MREPKPLDGTVFYRCDGCKGEVVLYVLQEDECPKVHCVECQRRMHTYQMNPGQTLEEADREPYARGNRAAKP